MRPETIYFGVYPNQIKLGYVPHKTEVWRFVTFALKTYQNRWSGPDRSFRQHQGAWKNSIQTASLDSFLRLKFSWSNVGSQKSLFFKYDDVQGYVLLFNKSLHSQRMLQVWYKQKIVCRWIGSSISQPSSCQREQERLEAAEWCLPLVRSDQESYIRRFIGRLACHGRKPIFNAFEILEWVYHSPVFQKKYLYHQVSVSDIFQMGGQKLDALAITVRLLVDVSPMAFYGRDLLVSQCHGRWGHLDCNGWCARTPRL